MVTKPKVEYVRITNFRCIRRAELGLTSLHALIGPNDTGKSTILRALADDFDESFVQYLDPQEPSGVEAGDSGLPADQLEDYEENGLPWALRNRARPLLRLDPDSLRASAKLLTRNNDLWFADERGSGLVGLYDALLSRDRRAFIDLEDQFKALFPMVDAIRLENLTEGTKELGVTLRDGKVVRAKQMSEGMLYWLAFAILSHLAPLEMILVEEPENGLHPSRIRDVMRILRSISEQTQVVLATHSPLVINELGPDEVTIVTRTPERGTICTPMRRTKNFQERAEAYALGELWLSYADGDLEKELVGDDSTPAKE